jgi:hypothetical protein
MEIDNYGFIAFIKAYAEDSFELRALKCQYNLCAARVAIAIIRGRNERRQGLLEELRILERRIDHYE